MLSATRGRDIPKSHVSDGRGPRFSIPYLTSGRSVKRYYIDSDYVTFTDDWFRQDSGLMHSYTNELLVATKNFRYPRCVIKPKGFLHGGGIVRIDSPEELDDKALGLILNSRLVRYVCKRYLTNYSELTTCLNTGIMNDLPMRIPEDQEIFRTVFSVLSQLHSPDRPSNPDLVPFFERLGNALVYELFFGGDELQRSVFDCLDSEYGESPERLRVLLDTRSQKRIIRGILRADHVKTIERHQ
jgi:hypothetical protein